jgi:hypothetical protein
MFGVVVGNEQRKKYPYYISVGYGVGQALRLFACAFYFMYDSFFLHFFFIMPALFVRCAERRSDGYWVCHCHRQAGE